MEKIRLEDLQDFPKCWNWMHNASARIQKLADFVRRTGDKTAYEDALIGLKLYKGMARHLAIEDPDRDGRERAIACYKRVSQMLEASVEAAAKRSGLIL